MKYETLEKIFYKYPNDYDTVYKQRFNNELAYKLPIFINGNQAFFLSSLEMVNNVTDILNISKSIETLLNTNFLKLAKDKVSTDLVNNKIIAKTLIKEIILTNDIEGIISTRKEVIEALENKSNSTKKIRFQGLVEKYSKIIKDEEIEFNTSKKVRFLYDDIVSNEINEDSKPDGEIFRKEIVYVTTVTQNVKHKGLIPESAIIEAMESSFRILDDENIPSLFRTAIFHYLIGYIHPFYDGNGRLSRFISSYLLKKDLNVYIALNLSYAIKKKINKYYESFNICNNPKNKGELTYFINIFLEIVSDSAISFYNNLKDSLDKMIFYIETIINSKFSYSEKSILIQLIQSYLFSYNEITIDELVEYSDVNVTTTREILNKLIELNFLSRKRVGKYIYSLVIEKIESL